MTWARYKIRKKILDNQNGTHRLENVYRLKKNIFSIHLLKRENLTAKSHSFNSKHYNWNVQMGENNPTY